MSSTQSHFFVSYSRKDSAIVDRLADDLRAAGIAVWIDREGMKPGTPDWEDTIRDSIAGARGLLYIASEQGRASDYVHSELEIAKLRGVRIIPVWVAGAHLADAMPMGYTRVNAVDLRGTSYAAGLDMLIAGLRDETPFSEPPPSPEPPPVSSIPRNPYKGLHAFTEADRADFYGRGRAVEEMLGILRASPSFLAVIGASGSGKSSAVMAGLLPSLYSGEAVPGSKAWLMFEPLKPGAYPLEALAIAFGKRFPQLSPTAIDDALNLASRRGLHRLAKQVTSARLLLFIDQFEEVFAPTVDERERRTFIELITTAADDAQSGVCIILTLRADFYHRALAFPDLARLLSRHSHTLLPMGLSDLFQVVRLPAEADDVRLVFQPELIEEMVFTLRDQPGTLPLLQFTLDQLFERRDGRYITCAAYDAIGGVHGALANHAEAVYAALPEADRSLARDLFLRLVTSGEDSQPFTRRRARLSELVSDDADTSRRAGDVARRFTAARLLTSDTAGDEPVVELAHEVLISAWERLRGWIDEARALVRLQARIAADAREWLRGGRSDDRVYRGEQLREAEAWLVTARASQDERAFVEAGVASRQRAIDEETRLKKVLRVLRLGVGAAAVAAIVIALIAGSLGVEVRGTQERIDSVNAEFERMTGVLSDVEVARAFCVTGIKTPLILMSNTIGICERMVELSRPRDQGFYRDFRGIARGLYGDTAGALADFRAVRTFYNLYTPNCTTNIALRDAWISQLETGVNPFAEAGRAAALADWEAEPDLNDC